MFELEDVAALAQLSPLIRGFMPWNGGALKPSALAFVLRQVDLLELRTVVELGSGISTVFLASALRSIGGTLVSVEHDPEWVRRTRRMLAFEDFGEDLVRVLEVPLLDQSDGLRWYDGAPLAPLLRQPIDLLLVDGPPAQDPARRGDRYPAAGFFIPALHRQSLVVLDDVWRPGEAEIVKRWAAEHDLRLQAFESLGLAAGRIGRVGMIYP
jgi:predicted O-methyltransferase YrrM